MKVGGRRFEADSAAGKARPGPRGIGAAVLALGAVAVGIYLAALVHEPAPAQPESAVSLAGSGSLVSGAFNLRGGYYTISRTVTSLSSEDCYFYARLETMAGAPRDGVEGPLLRTGATETWRTSWHYARAGDYAVHVISGCGDWTIEIARQTAFDE